MKHTPKILLALLLAFGSAVLLNAQTKTSSSQKASAKTSGKADVTDLIIYDFVLYDTTKAETVGKAWSGTTMSDYNLVMNRRHLNAEQSLNFRNEIQNMLKKKDLFYFDGENPMTHQKVLDRTTVSKEVTEYDSLGNVIGTKRVTDTIDMRNWKMITFYEEWKLNRSNGMLEKEVLGYVFHWYNEKKRLYIPMFGVARDKAAQERIKKLKGW